VNTNKSKVIVFHLGGHLAVRERWHIGNDKLEVVKEYLGIMFSTKLCTNTALHDRAKKETAAVINIIKTMSKLSSTCTDIFFNCLIPKRCLLCSMPQRFGE